MSGLPAGIASGKFAAVCLCVVFGLGAAARAELPTPVLNTLFPSGAQAGATVEVGVEGSGLDGLNALRFHDPGVVPRKGEGNRFTVTIPAALTPGIYDARTVGTLGISSPRSFVVSRRTERRETEPNDTLDSAETIPLDVVVNGRVEKPGDVDCCRFTAAAGQRVVIECLAERIDSKLRAVLELYDAQGGRLAANRGAAGIDPLLDYVVPAAGTYTVKLFDLTFAGSGAHVYRLDVDTGPRVEFAHPCVVQRGKTTRVALFGRNLVPHSPAENPLATVAPTFDRVELEITPPLAPESTGLRLRAAQLTADLFAYDYPGGHAPVLLAATDVPVVLDASANHSPGNAQELAFPCEVSGQLEAGDEQDWFAVQASRGEVLWIEAFGERIGSPVDLDVAVLDPTGERELAHLTDCLENPGGYRFPLNHADPAGRWVAPADGRYLILIRNLTGGLSPDPRRVYRLGIRREEPDFDLAVISRRTDQPAALNAGRGGREMLEIFAVRRRGLTAPIRVAAEDLPAGIECPEVWIGPGVERVPLVVTAGRHSEPLAAMLKLTGRADSGGGELVRTVRGGTMIWPGQPTPSGRLTDDVPVAIGPESPLLVTATIAEADVDQDSVLDIAVEIERRNSGHAAAVTLSAVGLPPSSSSEIVTIPAGETKGWISFPVPAALPPGPYTFAVQAETEVLLPAGGKPISGTFVSNPVTVRVAPARIALAIDPRSPRKIARGKIIQLGFTAERKHGFIGKIHTELTAPGGVVGLRARGVTLVGQSDSGSLQVIANEDAPLGRQPLLRLEAVGTVEDRPVYHASRFVELEITE